MEKSRWSSETRFGMFVHWGLYSICGDVIGELLKNPQYHCPSQQKFEHYWQNKCLAQVRELIEDYGPSLLWFSTRGKMNQVSTSLPSVRIN